MGDQRDFVIQDGILTCYVGEETQIVIPEGVEHIGDGAFIENKKIQSVVLPQSLTWIGMSAFSECVNLKSITIPANVTFIDKLAFSNSGLEEVVIKGKPEIRLWAFEGTPWKNSEEKKAGGFVSGNVLLSVNPELTEYTIPPDVKVIGRDAFKNSKIKEIIIPEGVTRLDICAFSYSELERISLPETLKIIEAYAFSNCEKLTELLIPKSVSDIGDRALEEMPDCVITILNESDDEELFRISSDAFGWNAPHVKEVRVPYGSVAMRYAMKAGLKVTTLPCKSEKFGNPKKYEYIGDEFCCIGGTLHEYFGHRDVVYVPDGIHTIGERAFMYAKIQKVHLPRSVKVIKKSTFNSCENLVDVVGEGVEEIERDAFSYCKSLTRVEFVSLKWCFDIAFENCDQLKRENIIIPDDAKIIEVEFKPCGCGYCHIKNTPFTPKTKCGERPLQYNRGFRRNRLNFGNLSERVMDGSIKEIGQDMECPE